MAIGGIHSPRVVLTRILRLVLHDGASVLAVESRVLRTLSLISIAHRRWWGCLYYWVSRLTKSPQLPERRKEGDIDVPKLM